MLVILSFALVLVAVVLLVLGLLTSDGLGLIYASMACSLLAGIVLYAAIRMGRPRMQEATAGAPAPSPPGPRPSPVTALDTGERATAATAPQREALGTVAVLERDEPSAPPPDETGVIEAAVEEDDEDLEEGDEDFFPIADYDELNVSEIMPLLPELYPEELDEVEDHERATKARVTILTRIQELREELRRREAGEEWDVPDEGWRDDTDADATGLPASFPIPGYDNMTAPEITRRLAELGPDELVQVRAREQAVDARVTVLREIDRLLDEAGAPSPARAASPAAAEASRPTKRAPAKRSARKKAAAKKTAAKKAPARKTAAKKSPAKKAATKRAGAKKSPAKKTAAKKAPAKKAAKRSTKRSGGR